MRKERKGTLRRLRILLLSSLAFALIVAACGGDSELTFEELIGTWRCDECRSFLQLNEDGSYRVAITLSVDRIENATVEQGQFTLEGTLFTFISNEESKNCAAGQRGSYELEVLGEGPSGEDLIKQIQVEDECNIRGGVGDVILRRVS